MVRTLTVLECETPLAGSSLSQAKAAELERLFKLIADRSRLRILNILLRARGAPVCVCEFQATLGIAQPTVSYHLKQLAQAGLIERERRASFVYYRLVPGALERLAGLVSGAGEQSAVA
jgi:ArsR family transcriptional regulator, arsenate/arsenite/antimonite-responsive transcriptional repressor